MDHTGVATSRRAMWLLYSIVAALLWAFAVWQVYFQLPDTRRLGRDFGLKWDPLSSAWIDHAWWITLVAALGAGVAATIARRRQAGRLTLLLTPLAIGTISFLVGFLTRSGLLDRLSG